jgi:cytochrome b561
MLWRDSQTGYGWVSIALHWITAVAIIYMLFLGNSIAVNQGEARVQALNLHTSVGIANYIVLWGRIVWRAAYGHPGPMPGQQGTFYTLGKWTHYVLLAALGVMLVTGPAMAWASGIDVAVFDWFSIPSATQANFELRDLLHRVHRASAITIFIGIVLHLGGVYKHTAFNRDGTFVKMIVPDRDGRNGQ